MIPPPSQDANRPMSEDKKRNPGGVWWELAAGHWAASVIDGVRGIVLGNFLDSRGLGQVGVFNLVASLAKYGNLGLRTVGTREYVHSSEIGDQSKADHNRNVCFSVEIGFSAALAIATIAAVWLLDFSASIAIFVTLGAAALVLRKVISVAMAEAVLQHSYRAAGRAQIVDSVLAFVFSISLVYVLGSIGLPIAAIIAGLGVLYLLVRFAPMGFRPTLDWKGALPLLLKGLSLSLSTVMIGVNAVLLRVLMIQFYGLEVFGEFSLMYGLVNRGVALLLAPVNADSRRFFEDFAHARERMHRLWARVAIMSGVGLVATVVAWSTIPVFLAIFIPRHSDAAALGQLVSLVVLPVCAGSYAGIGLTARSIDTPSRLWIGRLLQAGIFLVLVALGRALTTLDANRFLLIFVVSEYVYHGHTIFWLWLGLRRLRRRT